MATKDKPMKVTPHEADLLLYALDKRVKTDANGKVPRGWKRWGKVNVQDLRDRLMAFHKHPEEE